MMKFRNILILVILINAIALVSSLGISPALKDVSFEPGKEVNVTFFVLDASEDSFYDISIRGGDLEPYSTLSTTSVKGGSNFILTIHFPQSINEPGQHTVSVSIKERPSESSFINTIVEVGSVVTVFVPYPGIYGDLSLNVPDGNVDDKLPVELHVINRGDNILSLDKVFIDLVSAEDSVVLTANFTPVDIPVGGDRYFRKYMDTQGISPGNYLAIAHVFYSGNERQLNKSLKIGSLFVNITNYTRSIEKNGIQKFYVTVESQWNSPISAVYVDVNISNNLNESYSFRTPSIDLKPWEKKDIESYLDTDKLEGIYTVNLNASYLGQSSYLTGSLEILSNNQLLAYSLIIAGVVILVAILIIWIIKRSHKKGKRK